MENTYISTTERGLTKDIKISVPWGHVSAKTWGNSSSKPVLCIHGWMDNCNSFDTLIPLLPKDNFYLCIDLPGCGKSSFFPPGMFYFKADIMSLVYSISKYFSWDRFSIMGHSLGGNVGGMFSGIFPEKVDKLILIDSPGLYTEQTQNIRKRVQWAILQMHKLESTEIKKHNGYTFASAKSRLLEANINITNEAANILLQRGTNQLHNGLYEFSRDKRNRFYEPSPITFRVAREVVSNVKAHTLLIIAKDGEINLEGVKKNFELVLDTVKTMKNYQTVWVKGKHFVHLCHPEIIAQQISNHLNQPSRFLLQNTSSNL